MEADEMGLWERIKAAWKSEEKPVDPMIEAQRQIDEARALHRKLEGDASLLMTQKRQLSSDHGDMIGEVEKWSHLATRAAELGNEQAVTQAIIEKADASTAVMVLEQRITDLQASIDGMGVRESGERLVAAQRELDQMVARGGASDIRERMARILSQDPTSAMSQVKEQVMAKEAGAEAWDEMTGNTDDLKPTAADEDVKAEVARLMNGAMRQD
jgi:phage shock protein A